jgi:hypothetical protein
LRTIKLESEFRDSIEDIESLISQRRDGVADVTDIAVFVGLEDTDHIVEIEEGHEGGYEEEEPSDSHPGIYDNSRRFVLLIHVLLVVDVVCSHFEDQSIIGSPPPETVKALRLVTSQSLWRESIEVAVVRVF